MDNISETIKNYLIKENGIDQNIKNDTPLFSGGILDSLDVVALLEFIEKTYSAKFSPFDVGLEQLDSITLIEESIQKHLQK